MCVVVAAAAAAAVAVVAAAVVAVAVGLGSVHQVAGLGLGTLVSAGEGEHWSVQCSLPSSDVSPLEQLKWMRVH